VANQVQTPLLLLLLSLALPKKAGTVSLKTYAGGLSAGFF
jgi:hypothetical protein